MNIECYLCGVSESVALASPYSKKIMWCESGRSVLHVCGDCKRQYHLRHAGTAQEAYCPFVMPVREKTMSDDIMLELRRNIVLPDMAIRAEFWNEV